VLGTLVGLERGSGRGVRGRADCIHRQRLGAAQPAVPASGDTIDADLRAVIGIIPQARERAHYHGPILARSEVPREARRWDDVRMADTGAKVRIDKWLWAARFHKTRALATAAVSGGRVHVNGQRVKPARDVRLDDIVEITRPGHAPLTIVVRAVSDHRGPATAAQLLYVETPESVELRERDRLMRKMAPQPAGPVLGARPTKRDRRRFDQARRGDR